MAKRFWAELGSWGIMVILFFAFVYNLLPRRAEEERGETASPEHTYVRPVKTFVIEGEMFITQEGDFRVGVTPDGWICYKDRDWHECHNAISFKGDMQ